MPETSSKTVLKVESDAGAAGSRMNLYGIDIETHDPCLTDKGASWVYGEGGIIVTGLFDAGTGAKKALDGNGGQTVKNLLLDPNVTLVGVNVVYDLGWLCHEHSVAARDMKCGVIDVSIAEASIDEYQPCSLDALAWKYLRERKDTEPLEMVCNRIGLNGDFRKHLRRLWDGGYKSEIRAYVTSDAGQPVRIWEKQRGILSGKAAIDRENFSGCMDALLTNFKLIKIVLDMKQRGVRVDMRKRKKNYALLKKTQENLQAGFEAKYGKVNFNSPKQLAGLFDRQGIPYRCKIRIKGFDGNAVFAGSELWEQRKRLKEFFNGVRVQKGQLVLYTAKQYSGRTNDDLRRLGYVTTCNPSIDRKALDAVKNTHEAAKSIVDLKQVTSIIDKFIGPRFDRFIVRHGPDDYRVHADFNIVGARQTGRFSSANPNLHQVPSKTVLFAKTKDEIKLYKLCRETIVPDKGCLIGKADYSGQENRLIAHFAVGDGAAEIRRGYNENPDLDFHDYIGEISGLYDEYGPEVGRKYAKNCSFGLGYGMQIQTMTETFSWSREDAERITMLYHDAAPFVKTTMDKASEVIVNRGFIRTLAGRHCHLRSYNNRVDTRSAYKGFNKLIQGSAADMMKKAMVMLDECGLLDVFPLLLTVHDEIDFNIPKTVEAASRLPEILDIMEHTFPISVPIRVDPEVGRDWGHVKGREKTKNEETGEVKVETLKHFIRRIAKSVEAVYA